MTFIPGSIWSGFLHANIPQYPILSGVPQGHKSLPPFCACTLPPPTLVLFISMAIKTMSWQPVY